MSVRGDPRRLIPWLLLVATAVAYSRLPVCGFTLWDDPSTVCCNPRLNLPAGVHGAAAFAYLVRNIGHYWATPDRGLYVPVTNSVWGVLAMFAQHGLPNASFCQSLLRPSVFHIANLLIHMMATLTVYLILKILVRNAWAACGGALLFALHPVQVESVAWVSGLKDVLCGFLSLVAIWQYLKYAIEAPAMLREGDRWWAVPGRLSSYHWAWHFLAATVAFVLAMLSKPAAVTLPLIVFTLDALMLRRPIRRMIGPTLLWIVLAAPMALVIRAAQLTPTAPVVPFHLRPVIAGFSLAFYTWKLIAPTALTFDYGLRPDKVLTHWWAYTATLVPIIFGSVFILARRRRPWLLAAALLFVLGVLPVLGFTTFGFQYLSTVADHYLYLAMLGPALALASILSRHRETPMAVACGLLFGAFAMRCYSQTLYWKDDESLNLHALAINPDSYPAHMNYALDLKNRGEFKAALQEYRQAVHANPDHPGGHGELAVMAATLKDMNLAQFEADRLLAIARTLPRNLSAEYVGTYVFLARQWSYRDDTARAQAALESARELDPTNPEVMTWLAALSKRAGSPSSEPAKQR